MALLCCVESKFLLLSATETVRRRYNVLTRRSTKRPSLDQSGLSSFLQQPVPTKRARVLNFRPCPPLAPMGSRLAQRKPLNQRRSNGCLYPSSHTSRNALQGTQLPSLRSGGHLLMPCYHGF